MNPHEYNYWDFMNFEIYEIKKEIEEELEKLKSEEMNKKWESIKNDGYWNTYSDFYNEIEIYKAENK